MAELYMSGGSDKGYFGIDATFAAPIVPAKSFVIVLNAMTKSDAVFDHFEAFDFTSKSWIEIGATSPNAGRPSLSDNPSLVSTQLPTWRFTYPATGEVWTRAIWVGMGDSVVYVDQLALIYYR